MGRGEADLEVMRGDLSRILYDATRADVEYIFGDTVVGVDQADGTVTFKNGEPRTFDAEQEFVNDLGHLVSIGTVPNHLGLDRQELIFSVPGRTLNLYSTGKGQDA